LSSFVSSSSPYSMLTHPNWKKNAYQKFSKPLMTTGTDGMFVNKLPHVSQKPRDMGHPGFHQSYL
jgi:hypothetical protein